MGISASTARTLADSELTRRSDTKQWAQADTQLNASVGFLVKEQVLCLCEGGKSCSRENPAKQKGGNAIRGLHSNWVGDKILAMARPWQESVTKQKVVEQFKEHNIGLIVNLQELGEHEGCGPGNLACCGFTYNPDTFMAGGVRCTNFGWRDMCVPTLERMMDIVQVMQQVTKEERKKVAVHCHAGLGRTGLAIACFLVYSEQMTAAKAVEMVRASRPGALQTKQQEVFVSIFQQYVQFLRCLFKVADPNQVNLGMEAFVPFKVGRRLSRSVSSRSADTVAALTSATAVSSVQVSSPLKRASGSTGDPSSLDWTTATYNVLTPAEAEALKGPAGTDSSGQSAGAASGTPLSGTPKAASLEVAGSGGNELVMHARRASAGTGNLTLVTKLEVVDQDKPLHVISTDANVTEVYGDGLTIIRAAKHIKGIAAGQNLPPSDHDLGLDMRLPWNEKFHIKPECFSAEGFIADPPSSYLEALKRQQRLAHGMARRQSARLHQLLRMTASGVGRVRHVFAVTEPGCGSSSQLAAPGGADPHAQDKEIPNFASLMLVSLITHGRLPDDRKSAWSSCPRVQLFGLQEPHHLNEALLRLKLAISAGDYNGFEAASPALMLCVLSDWFGSFTTESVCESSLAVLVDESERLLQLAADVDSVAADGLFMDEVEVAGRTQQYMTDVRAVCCALQPHEQELFLIIAAILRHVLNCISEDPHIPGPTPEELARLRSSSGGGAVETATPMHRGHSLSLFSSGSGIPGVGGLMHAPSGGFHLPRFSSGVLLPARHSTGSGGGAGLTAHARTLSAAAGSGGSSGPSGPQQNEGALFAATVCAAAAAAFPPTTILGGSLSAICRWAGPGASSGLASIRRSTPAGQAQQQNAAAAMARQLAPEVALRALCRCMASWLLSPLCVACPNAVDSADAFLWFLTVHDAGFKCLLQVRGEQGIRNNHSQDIQMLRARSGAVTGSGAVAHAAPMAAAAPSSPRRSPSPSIAAPGRSKSTKTRLSTTTGANGRPLSPTSMLSNLPPPPPSAFTAAASPELPPSGCSSPELGGYPPVSDTGSPSGRTDIVLDEGRHGPGQQQQEELLELQRQQQTGLLKEQVVQVPGATPPSAQASPGTGNPRTDEVQAALNSVQAASAAAQQPINGPAAAARSHVLGGTAGLHESERSILSVSAVSELQLPNNASSASLAPTEGSVRQSLDHLPRGSRPT